MSSSLSLRCEAGSTSSYGIRSRGHSLGKPKALPHGSKISDEVLENYRSSSEDYQVSRFINERIEETVFPFFYTGGLGDPSFVSESWPNFENQTRGIDPFEPLPVLRTGTYSSVASDDSHCSVPRTNNLVKGPDKNRISFYDEHEIESDCDEDEDAFRALNTAVIQILGPDRAVDLIPHLYQLPAPLRAVVFGFEAYTGHGIEEDGGNSVTGDGDSGPSYPNPIQRSIKSPTPKRRRVDKSKSRAKTYETVQELKFACHFNIFDPKRYCLHNEMESTGGRYISCMGTGFSEPRRLKEHFESCHRMPQCQRCWAIFDSLESLSYHRDKEEPRCEDQTNLLVEKKETITELEWNKLQRALSQTRGKRVSRKSGQEMWFAVWDILFPQSTYKDVARPVHPYYVDPEGGTNPIPTYPDIERMIEICKTLWDENSKSVKTENPYAEYHPSKEDVVKMIREAASLTKESPPNPLPEPSFMPDTTSVESAVQSYLPFYSENIQSGYYQTPPEVSGFFSQPELNGLNNSALPQQFSCGDNYDGGSDVFDL